MVVSMPTPSHYVEPLADFERLRATLRKYALDAVICSVPHNVFYLSNFDHPPMWHFPFHAFAVVPAAGDPALVISGLGLSAPSELNLSIADIYPFGQREVIIYDAQELLEVDVWLRDFKAGLKGKSSATPFDAIARVLRDRGVAGGKIGFDDASIVHRIPIDTINAFDAVDVMREVRMIKTPAEIAWVRRAAEANEDATIEAIATIPGATTWEEVVNRYKAEVALRGGDPKYMIGGAPHHTSTFSHQFTDYPLRPGENYFVDSLSTFNHYHGDFGRQISWGEPSAEITRRYNAMRTGLAAGIEAARPGMTMQELGQVVSKTVNREGFTQFFASTPHSVGLEHTDTPRIQGIVIQANMTLNFDIVYMEAGFGALHLEDTFLVTESGSEWLTSGNNEIFVV